MGLSKSTIIASLQDTYGESVTAADIRAWCAMNDCNYQTVSNKLSEYKTSRGKWNLTIPEQLEQNYQAPAAEPVVQQNLIPQKDDSFVKFVTLTILKKLFSPAHSTLRLSRVSRAMVKRSLLSKRVPNSDEN